MSTADLLVLDFRASPNFLDRNIVMKTLDRRSFVGSTVAIAALGSVAEAGECTRSYDWETMSLEERNLAFNNVAQVTPEFAAKKTEEWTAATSKLREQHPQHLNLPYGPKERNKWDIYPASAPAAPCLVHVHGGYWQRGSKEVFGCLVEGALARGWSAALPGYTLAPDAGLTQIANELRTALDWLASNGREHGVAGPLIISGWSAGGHLTALLLDHPKVTAGLAISGVFDLAPLRDSPHVNDKVKLTEVEIKRLSPMRLPGVNKPLSISYGTSELPAMVDSSRDFHAYRAHSHLPGQLIPVVKTNHFTTLEELRRPNGLLTRAVLDLE
jgi:arylformamidase